MYKFYALVVSPPLLIFAIAGIMPSVLTGEWTWFARSGALLTAYGVILAYLDLSGAMREIFSEIQPAIEESFKNILEETFEELSEEYSEKKSVPEIHSIFEEAKDEVGESLSTLGDKLVSNIRFYEILLIIVGTVIWGYGDLLSNLFGPL